MFWGGDGGGLWVTKSGKQAEVVLTLIIEDLDVLILTI